MADNITTKDAAGANRTVRTLDVSGLGVHFQVFVLAKADGTPFDAATEASVSRLISSAFAAAGTGHLATTGFLSGGVYNATPPTIADTNQAPLGLDPHGAAKVAAVGEDGNPIYGVATPSWSVHTLIAAGSMNATTVKNSAGKVGGWYLKNEHATEKRYVHLYNKATDPDPSADSALIKLTIALEPKGAANVEFSRGIDFSSGIGFTITAAAAATDETAVGGGDVILNLLYE